MKTLIRPVIYSFGLLFLAVLALAGIGYGYSHYLANYEYQFRAWPDPSQFDAPVALQTDTPRYARILSIQGGALLGLADLEVLSAIEERSGQPIYELFDFVAGSSTGAIIATLLLLPQEDTGKPMSAAEAIRAYDEFASSILSAPAYHNILTTYGFFGPALTNWKRVETAQQLFGTAQFADLLRPTMFPSYSQKTGDLKMFRNWDALEANIYLWPLVSAVTSVPSVFPAIALIGNEPGSYFYGDPALVLNQPANEAYLHARTNLDDIEKFQVVALGSKRDFTITDDIGVRGGMLAWFTPAFRLLYRGQSDVSYGALDRHASFDSSVDVSLTVLSPSVPGNTSSLDPSASNREFIREKGREYIAKNGDAIDKLVKELTDKPSQP
ncbi:MAG: patatin-like phospholipase family protein [Pseudomonadota bacterium]